MSKAGDGEDENECFYESLDRILSSATSCSSSSAGEDDDKDHIFTWGSPNDAPDLPTLRIPRFPMGVSNNYDMWTSEPLSVEERRIRLLCKMGLSRDPVLTRHRSSLSCASEDGGGISRRSMSADISNGNAQLIEVSGGYSAAGRSDAGTNHDRGESSPHDYCNCNSSRSSPQILSINSVSPSVIGDSFVNSHSAAKSRIGNGSLLGMHTNSPNKPPSGKRYSCLEEYRNDSKSSNLKSDCSSSPLSWTSSLGELHGASDCNEIDGDDDSVVCTIKNLDNGEEFLVKEIREDGMWNKVKEVGTGRHLTMEEFESFVGHSPIVQELMRRQNVEDRTKDSLDVNENGSGGGGGGTKLKKRGSWLKSIRNAASSMTGLKDRRSSDEKDTSSEKYGRRSTSAIDDIQDVPFHGPQRVRVRQYGKSCKELTALYKTQEIQAHTGSIWTIKFSLDGKYLASAGEDCVIHVWQVLESERKPDLFMDRPEDGNLNIFFVTNGSPEPTSISPKKRRLRSSITRKSVSLDCILLPETVFSLSEKPVCTFQGHVDDVLDLSWSKSQHLLSSSMDKTVRLWNLSSESCLKVFAHSDYVTCIQFNPVDDRYFISGSLDAKVRIWSIPDRQVVDWSDLHEMVTAACYTPDGQDAMVGSYKGSCRVYNTSENKLQQKGAVNLQNKNKKSHHKKITGFQFSPGSSSEVLITSADSRIRVLDGDSLVHKFKGFRNSNSQISGSITGNGKYVICASEDSHVYVWRHKGDSRPSGRSKGVTVSQSYEHFHCQDVSVAAPWPGISNSDQEASSSPNHPPPTPSYGSPLSSSGSLSSPPNGRTSATNNYFFDRFSATWPEEKLVLATTRKHSPGLGVDDFNDRSRSAWGMVIVTAGLQGKITSFQNFGLPVRF